MVPMLGWFNADAARASFPTRFSRLGSAATSAGRTLTATSRASRVSLARQTSPIPPAPRGASTSYGPSRAPEASVMTSPSFQPLDEVELRRDPAAHDRPGVTAWRHSDSNFPYLGVVRKLLPEAALPGGDVVEPDLVRPLRPCGRGGVPVHVEISRILAPLQDLFSGRRQSRKHTVRTRSIQRDKKRLAVVVPDQ